MNKRSLSFRKQNGLTLLEILVAITIGLMVVAGTIQIYLGTSETYRFQNALSRIQENGRFAMQHIQREVRMAGFMGCTQNIKNWLNPSGSGYVENFFSGVGVVGWEASGTAPSDNYTLGTTTTWSNGSGDVLPSELGSNLQPGSDVFVVSRAVPADITLSGNPSPPANTLHAQGATGIPQRALIIAVKHDCSGGDFWQKTSNESSVTLPKGVASGFGPGNINPDGGFSVEHDDQSEILQLINRVYFIRTGASGQPSLFTQAIGPVSGNAQELIRGVENMQVIYGVNSGGNLEYRTADNISDWSQVVAARVSLLLMDGAHVNVDAPNAVNLGGTIITPTQSNRLRQVFSTTVGIRNNLP